MELTPSAPLLAHYSVDRTPPVAYPIHPVAIPLSIANPPLAQLPTLNILPVHTCNDCNSPFIRNEKDRGSSAYYRCASCQSKMLQKAVVYSCVIY
jgi:DNA-directed RNA polymerase subunit RPC12/RpoP